MNPSGILGVFYPDFKYSQYWFGCEMLRIQPSYMPLLYQYGSHLIENSALCLLPVLAGKADKVEPQHCCSLQLLLSQHHDHRSVSRQKKKIAQTRPAWLYLAVVATSGGVAEQWGWSPYLNPPRAQVRTRSAGVTPGHLEMNRSRGEPAKWTAFTSTYKLQLVYLLYSLLLAYKD